ncbi:major facilitator superfamily domain-containing protein [Dichotomocladium elegans]|nr:major facilitator superfamily domain-containing protein [Dichotomocladium elegans]
MAIVVANIKQPCQHRHLRWCVLLRPIKCLDGRALRDPWNLARTLRVSAVLAFISTVVLAQTYAGYLPGHFVLCAIYLAVLGIAGSAAYLCALDSQSHNFRTYRGMSMGLASTGLGLCGVVFSRIDDIFFDDNVYGLLVFMAVAMSMSMCLGGFVLGPLEPAPEEDIQVQVQAIDDSEEDEETVPLLTDHHHPRHGLTGIRFFKHPAGFALFSTMLVNLGLGYVYLASIGQLLESLPSSTALVVSPQRLRSTHVALFSLSNCIARAVFGSLSDMLKKRWGIDRLWVFVGATVGLLLTTIYLVIGVTSIETLLPSTFAVAVTYGAAFGVAPAATTEFGTEFFARNWGWLLFAPALGSQIFNVLFGALYDREAKRQGNYQCQGPSCFRSTFLIGAGCILVVFVIQGWAIIKMRLYRPSKLQ